MRYLRCMLACLALMPLMRLASAQTPNDVPQGHWAYEAVQDLASKGLIKGYPPDGNFFGGRTVTRYEMAVLVQRVLARVDDLLSKKADAGSTTTPTTGGVTPEQLDEVRHLVEEYKTELTVMGTDLQKVKDELGGLHSDVDALKGQVSRHDAALNDFKQGLQAALDSQTEMSNRINKLDAGKVDAGFGRIKVDGLLQTWIQAEKNAPDKGVIDSFRLRRMEIKLSGNVNPKAYWTVMFDLAKQLSLNTKSSGGNITSVSVNQSSAILQDAYIGVHLTPMWALEVGQQKVPLSMEWLRVNAQLYTVERAIFNSTLPINNGLTGNVRDVGGLLRLTHPMVDAQVGIFDDSGNLQNTTDNNNEKELAYHADYKGLRHLTIGGYQAISGAGGGVGGLTTITQRNRQGLEAAAVWGPHRLEAEVVRARDGSPIIRSQGGYAIYIYRLNPKWEFVARGETWNPNRGLHTGSASFDQEYDLTLGANWYMTGHNAKIQFNWVRKNINGSQTSFLGADRNLFLVNFQEAY